MRALVAAKLYATAVLTGVTLLCVTGYLFFQASRAIETEATVRSAASFLEILSDTQSFYASRISSRAQDVGHPLTTDIDGTDNALPYPATFMHGLVRDISERHPEEIRFFSPLPFVSRPDSGPRDDFEWEAWTLFSTESDLKHFSRTVETENGPVLRYAVPIRMSETCIECHSTHPESPHKSWNVGDLRGVQAISLPVQSFERTLASRPVEILSGLGLAVLVLIISLVAGSLRLLRGHRQLDIARHEIETVANTDPMTGLGNRMQFLKDLEDLVGCHDKEPDCSSNIEQTEVFTLMLVDARNFRFINEAHGQAAGDAVVRHLASLLVIASGKEAAVYRVGPDEFGVLLRAGQSCADVEQLYGCLTRLLSDPFEFEGKRLTIEADAGFGVFPRDGGSQGDMLAAVNLALREAISGKQPGCRAFAEEMREAVHRENELARELRQAIANRELVLFFQPQLDFKSRTILGFEALIRWKHPERGLLSPFAFLGIAEKHSLMLDIGLYVARTIRETTLRWSEAGITDVRLAFNLHHDELQDPEHLKQITRIIEGSNWEPSRLTFEITEGCIIDSRFDPISQLSRWREAGYGVALDDFGTGYASLVHLKDLPVSEIKIDRSFAADIEHSPQTRSIVQSIADLSHALGMSVVAEGVENGEQSKFMASLGCDLVQGYAFGRPMAEDKAVAMLKRLQASPGPTGNASGSPAATTLAPSPVDVVDHSMVEPLA